MIVLGIETSCDETSVAFLEVNKTAKKSLKIKPLANTISSQIAIHQKYGGVVPKLACREHSENIDFVFSEAVKIAFPRIKNPQKVFDKIDCLAVTNRPGLEIALLIGVNFSRALSWCFDKPLVPVSHIEGHLLSFLLPAINQTIALPKKEEIFPAIALIVSGGHTLLVKVNDYGKYQVLGKTRDDAAGECFDKGARILGLSYPGGPIIAQLAQNYREKNKTNGDKNRKKLPSLPRPMLKTKDYDFSFSGLKTALLYSYQKLSKKEQKQLKEYFAFELEEAITDVLVEKAFKAVKNFPVKSIILGGGVVANLRLREKIGEKAKDFPSLKVFLPELKYCQDNALMIALAGALNYLQSSKKKDFNWQKIKVLANEIL